MFRNLFFIGIATLSFSVLHAQPAQRFDILITEVMADPSPPVSLPNAEFIELKNTSGRVLNLSGWKLYTSSSVSSAFPVYNFPPDSFLILTATTNVNLLTSYGKTLGIGGFPSLTNTGSLLSLVSKEGAVIHALAYTDEWYGNPAKSEGGWTLEMIDPHNPCGAKANWTASTDAAGGTPGRKNAVDAINADHSPPRLIRTFTIDSLTVRALFDEPMDSLSACIATHYMVDKGMQVLSASPLSPLFDAVDIRLASPMQKRMQYELNVTAVKDCAGNGIGAYHQAKAGIAEDAAPQDVVINEILFDPRPNAYDYVEIFNRSGKIIDAAKLFLANRNSAAIISSLKKISEVPFYIFPGDFIICTEDPFTLAREYLVKRPEAVLSLSSLPSYPDDKGNVVLANLQGGVIDEVLYTRDWHFGLIHDAEGVALERIDPSGPSAKGSNWHSAAATSGYGTPGYGNSQYHGSDTTGTGIEVEPKLFSPDNDGQDDVLSIRYGLAANGFVANVFVFNARGVQVRQLAKNELLGYKGQWNWDGLDEKKARLPAGIYIIVTELFNLQGKKEQVKKAIVLARPM